MSPQATESRPAVSARVAIIGSGQLAQMMAQAGVPMSIEFSFLAEKGEDTRCVDSLGNVVIRQDSMDAEQLYSALGRPDVITVEKEHVDVALLKQLAVLCPVHPNPNALEQFKNRRVEKRFLESISIPIAPFHEVREKADLETALDDLNAPVFLKTEEEGYDGYNQHKITPENRDTVVNELHYPGNWVAEGFIPFDREISFLAARSRNGDIVYYPAVENLHRNGTLLRSLAPAPNMSDDMRERGEGYAKRIMETLDYVGVICVECFVWGDQLLVNEIAPRVHNSGHWSTKGAATSQFENHVRAVTGLPCGSTETNKISGMLNLLGVTLTAQQALDAQSFLTLYGKTLRAKRKLGHVTVIADDYAKANARLDTLQAQAYPDA